MLTPEGELDESWPIDDQHLRLRETTHLTTVFGNVDVVINPAAAAGYRDLLPDSLHVRLPGGVEVRIVTLERIIESKRAVDRPKDRAVLPRLERLQRRLRGQQS